MTPSTRKKGIVTSLGVLTAVATLLSGGVTTAYANDALTNPNSAMGYPSFKGAADPIPGTGVAFDPSTSYLKQVFDADVANGAGTDTAHDFWIDKMLTRTGTAPNGTGTNDAGDYNYAGADKNEYLFSRGRAAFMYTHTPEALGFVGDVAYWDQTGNDGFTVEVSIGGSKQTLRENTDKRKQTPSYFTTEFTNGDKTITVTEVKYITYTNVMVANFTITSTTGGDVTLTAASPFAQDGNDGDTELTGRFNVKNDLTTIYPRFSGNGFTVKNGKLASTLTLEANVPQTTKLQLGLIANELPDSTAEYEARFNGDLTDPAASYKDSVTTYNQWWVDNIPYVETQEHNIDKTVFYRWWLSRFNMLDANMPGNTFQYPTSIEGVLGYNNQIVLTSGMSPSGSVTPNTRTALGCRPGRQPRKASPGITTTTTIRAIQPIGTTATRSTSPRPVGTPTRCTAARHHWLKRWVITVPKMSKVCSIRKASQTATTTRIATATI